MVVCREGQAAAHAGAVNLLQAVGGRAGADAGVVVAVCLAHLHPVVEDRKADPAAPDFDIRRGHQCTLPAALMASAALSSVSGLSQSASTRDRFCTVEIAHLAQVQPE